MSIGNGRLVRRARSVVPALLLALLTDSWAAAQDGTAVEDPKAALDRIVARASARALSENPEKVREEMEAVERDLAAFAQKHAGSALESEARFQLGSILFRRGDASAALAALSQSIATARTAEAKAPPMLLLGQVKQARGDHRGAQEAFRRFLDEFPKHDLADRVRRSLELLTARENVAVGKPAPAFDKRGLKGESFASAQVLGKVYLLDFGATWCEPWKRDLGFLKTLYSLLKNEGFEVLGVAMDGPDEASLERFLEKECVTWPVFSDGREWDNQLARAYGIGSLPASVLVDRKGIVRFLDLPRSALEPAVRSLLLEGATTGGKK